MPKWYSSAVQMSAGQPVQGETDEHEPGQRRDGHQTVRRERIDPPGTAGQQRGERKDHPGGAVRGEEHQRQVVEGQDPGVPELDLGHEAERDRGGQHAADQHLADAVAVGQGDDHPDAGEQEDPGDPRREQVVEVTEPRWRELFEAHVDREAAIPVERQHPERGQRPGDHADHHHHLRATPRRPHDEQHPGGQQGEEERQQMAQPDQRQQACCQPTVAAGAQGSGQHAQIDQHQRQRERERVLPRHRREHVAADDVAGADQLPRARVAHQRFAVVHEDQGGHGERGRCRKPQVGQLGERIGRDRHGDQPGHRHQLERDVVVHRDHEHDRDEPEHDQHLACHEQPAHDETGHRHRRRHEHRGHHQGTRHPLGHGHDRVGRADHVVAEGGEPRVPVRRPAGEAPVREDVAHQVHRTPHMGAHVPAGRRGVPQQQVRVQCGEDVDARARHDQQGQPRRERLAEDASHPGDQSSATGVPTRFQCGKVGPFRTGDGDRAFEIVPAGRDLAVVLSGFGGVEMIGHFDLDVQRLVGHVGHRSSPLTSAMPTPSPR